MIKLEPRSGDAEEFVMRVQSMTRGLCAAYRPEELFVIRIDNWFDLKWATFSGKHLGALGVWKEKLTLPPFVPNRVVQQQRFLRNGTADDYVLAEPGSALHIDQSSVQNLQRRVADVVPDAVLVWLSGKSELNGRASIMAYVPLQDGYWTWCVELSKAVSWRVLRHRGITAQEFEEISKP